MSFQKWHLPQWSSGNSKRQYTKVSQKHLSCFLNQILFFRSYLKWSTNVIFLPYAPVYFSSRDRRNKMLNSVNIVENFIFIHSFF